MDLAVERLCIPQTSGVYEGILVDLAVERLCIPRTSGVCELGVDLAVERLYR